MFLSFRFLTSSEALLFKIGYSIKVKASTFSDLEPTSRFILASYNILPFISLLQCGPVFHGQRLAVVGSLAAPLVAHSRWQPDLDIGSNEPPPDGAPV